MEAWHQKNLVAEDFPFQLLITDIAEFPPHWHEELEIVYALEQDLAIGLNNEIYILNPHDILLIGRGEVHYFLMPPLQKSKRIILQFELSLFESFALEIQERRFSSPLIKRQSEPALNPHRNLESQILAIETEYYQKRAGYQLAIKARLCDLMVTLLRQVPMEKYSSLEQMKHLKKLERLEQVFHYVEENYTREILLAEVAGAASFSVYHFARFFKEATGMTFVQYLNNYRVSKAAKYLINSSDPITEIAFQAGFDSIKTFNRVFKQLKGCSPREYKKASAFK
jgi:AraC-like DNA-binding protein